MSDGFDPYHRWLGIRDQQRPPNHYRLLGLELFEDDADVIAEASDRQMGHVRTHQTGRHSETSQRLLNELAKAKVCLLNSDRKAKYDAKLRAQLGQQSETQGLRETGPSPVPAPIEPPPARGKPRRLRIILEVLSGPQQGTTFEFEERDTFTVGRSRSAGFAIPGDQALSRVHFSIKLNPPVCFLKNLSEKHSTLVNGRAVNETLLRHGDVISAGKETDISVELITLEEE